jgi:hypothetical protein
VSRGRIEKYESLADDDMEQLESVNDQLSGIICELDEEELDAAEKDEVSSDEDYRWVCARAVRTEGVMSAINEVLRTAQVSLLAVIRTAGGVRRSWTWL